MGIFWGVRKIGRDWLFRNKSILISIIMSLDGLYVIWDGLGVFPGSKNDFCTLPDNKNKKFDKENEEKHPKNAKISSKTAK